MGTPHIYDISSLRVIVQFHLFLGHTENSQKPARL